MKMQHAFLRSRQGLVGGMALLSFCLCGFPCHAGGTADAWGGYRITAGQDHGLTNISATYRGYIGLSQDGSVIVRSHPSDYLAPLQPNSGFIAIAAGASHCVGLKQSGTVVCWGDEFTGECTVPEPNQDFTAVDASYLFSMGLKKNGSVVCWGENGHSQCNVPEPNTNYIAISAGAWHSAGLKSDGSIVCWGNNDYNQCNVPEPNSDFTAVVAGSWHNVGLKKDGSVVCWGYNSNKQCDPPTQNTNFKAIAAGYAHTVGLKQDGSIICWGYNDQGQCNVPEPNYGFTAVDAYELMTVGIRQEYSIAGEVQLGNFIGSLDNQLISASISSSGIPLINHTSKLAPSGDGKYVFNSYLLPPYDVTFSNPHFLTVKATAIDPMVSLNISMTNGDADGSGDVNLFDFVVLDTKFGSSDPMADLDGSGSVNLFDYMVVDQNFGAKGD